MNSVPPRSAGAPLPAPGVPADNACGLTVCEAAAPNLFFVKRWRADGSSVPYDSVRAVNLFSVTLDGLDALHRLLAKLASRPRCCVLRGAILDPARTRGVRRLLHDDPATGDRATLREVPRRWTALDVDGLPLPEGTDPRDLAACARAVLPHLPPEFRRARCVIQATSSHCLRPGARLRLWFWLSRPTRGAELATWLRHAPVDPAAFRGAQPTYTAPPRFEGRPDPLPARLALLDAAEPMVRVPPPLALAPPPRVLAALPRRNANVGSRYADAALTRAATNIAGAAPGNRHATALREAWGLARLVRGGLLSEAEMRATIATSLAAAGKDRREAEALVHWALARRAEAGGVRR